MENAPIVSFSIHVRHYIINKMAGMMIKFSLSLAMYIYTHIARCLY
jgi:hypothetical protein